MIILLNRLRQQQTFLFIALMKKATTKMRLRKLFVKIMEYRLMYQTENGTI